MSWRGIFAGSLALIALQAVLGTANSANRIGSGLTWLADLVHAALDPSTPSIPDLAGVSVGGYKWPQSGPDGGGSGDGFDGGGGGGNGGGQSW